MADNIRKISYCYVTIPDRPGEGARVLEALKDAGVNLLAFHAFPVNGQAQLDLVVDDPKALVAAARQADLKLSEAKTAFFAEGEDRPGAAHDIVAKLAGAGIDLVAMDAVATQGRFGSLFWTRPEDVDRAAEVLGAH